MWAEQNIPGDPFYNVEFRAGFEAVLLGHHGNPEYITYNLTYLGCNAIIVAYGDSMYPEIRHGDKLDIKQVHTISHNTLFPREIYAIITENLQTIKYLHKGSSPNHVVLLPENLQKYAPIEISIIDITALFVVKVITRGRQQKKIQKPVTVTGR